ncbi:MAG TPA: retroviral-like aspartic protease family protein [Vicinamibacterales bacterium]|nr:retroviral-like aspartic protease family protein [Vicinamibacterales bacterium]
MPLAFDLTPQGAIIVPVIVDGAGPFRFLLDTGSNASVISEKLAAELATPIVAKTTLVSAGGRKDALVTRIEHLAMGTVTATAVLMTLIQPDALAVPDVLASGQHVQGVIGQDVLGTLRYTIDYRQRKIVWRDETGSVPSGATAFELEPHDNRFLVVLPQDRQVLRLVPDSGAERLVLFQRANRKQPPVTVADEPVGLTGLTGTRAARRAVVRDLKVGSTTLVDVPAVVIRRDDSDQADGLLPLHIFPRVTFSGPERQMFIEESNRSSAPLR